MTPRVHVWRWFFRLPGVRGFDGYCLSPWDIVIRPGCEDNAELLAHETRHCEQWHEHWLWFPFSYVWYGYDRNPFEADARRYARWAVGGG